MADDNVVIEVDFEFRAALDRLSSQVTAAMKDVASTVEKSVTAAFESFEKALLRATKATKEAVDATDAFGAANRRSWKVASDGTTEATNATKNYGQQAHRSFSGVEGAIQDIIKRLDLMDRQTQELNTTRASDLLGGKSSFAALGHYFRGADQQLRDLLSTIDQMDNLETPEAKLKLKALAEATRLLNAERGTLQSALKENSRQEIKAAQIAMQAAGHKARAEDRAAAERNIILQQSLQRRMMMEKSAQQESLQQMKNQGRLEAQQARADAEIRIQIARTAAKTILGIQRAAATATGAMFRGLGSMASGMVSRFRSSEKAVTASTGAELDRRSGMFRSFFRSQETMMVSSLRRQERLQQSFQARTSRGVAGAVTGRGVGGGMFAGLAGGAFVIAGLRAGMNEISNVAEQSSKVSVLFGDAAETMIQWSKQSVESMALTQGVALEAAGNFGALLKGAGMVQDDAAMAGMALTQLAADMASFNNTSVEDALQAIRSGLSGESEPLRRFNVFLNDATLKAKALELGLYSGKGVLDQYAKSQATLGLLFSSTADAQGDLARTADSYSNRLKFQKAQMVQFWGALAKPLTQVAAIIMSVTVPAMEFMTQFVKNDVGPALQMLRTALIGVAAGVGALVALKGAVEVIQLLGTTAKFALTPFGALVTIFGLAGGAVAIMWKHSEDFRDNMREIGQVLSTIFAPAVDAVKGAVEATGNGVSRFKEIVAAVGTAVSGFLLNAVKAFAGFVKNTLIPVFKTVVGFVRDNAIPAFQALGQFLWSVLGPALRTVAGFFKKVWDAIRPVLEPLGQMVDRIVGLGKAVASGLMSPMDAIKTGFSAVVTGIVGTFRNIGKFVSPAVASVRSFFKRMFSAENIKQFAAGALLVVHQIGYYLARIATDPRVLKALAAIAVLAASIAAAFVSGVVRGLASRIDDLGEGILNLLEAAIKFALSNPLLVAAILVGGKILMGFKNLGMQAGRAFGDGLRPALSQSVSNIRGYLVGLFGGVDGALNSSIKSMEGERTKLIRLFNGLNRDIETLGGSRMRLRTGDINEAAVRQAQDRLAQIKTDLGQSASQAILLRGRLISVGSAFSGIFTSGFNRQNIGFNLRVFGDAVRTTFADMRRDAKANGMSIGQTLGSGIAAGIGAAMGGYAMGRQGGGGVLMGILSSVGAGLAIGATGAGAPIGIAVAAIGSLATVMGAFSASAEDAKNELREWTSGLKDATTQAEISTETIRLLGSELDNEKTATKEFLGNIATETGVGLAQLGDAVSRGVEPTKAALRTMFAGFSDIEGFDWEEAFTVLTDGTVSEGTTTLAKDLAFLAVKSGYTQKEALALSEALDYLDDELGSAFEAQKANDFLRAAMNIKPTVEDAGTAVANVFQTAREKVDEARTAIDLASGALLNFLNPDKTELDAAFRDVILKIDSLRQMTFAQDPLVALAERGNVVAEFAATVGRAIQGAVNTGITDAMDIRTDVIQPFIDQIMATVEDPQLRDALLNNINTAFADIDRLQVEIDKYKTGTAALALQTELAEFFESNPVGIALDPVLDDPEKIKFMSIFDNLTPDVLARLEGLQDEPQAMARLVRDIIAAWEEETDKPGAWLKLPDNTIDSTGVLTEATTIGKEIAAGVQKGIEDGTAPAVQAAREMSGAILRELKSDFIIESPSRATKNIGVLVSKGLAVGIQSGVSSVNRASTFVALSALKQIGSVEKRVGKEAKKNARKARADSDGKLTRGQKTDIFAEVFDASATSLPQANEAFFAALADIRRNFEDVAESSKDAKEAMQEGSASVEQRDIFGESTLSLSMRDVLGRQNREALRTAAEAAADLAASQLAKSGDVKDVLANFRANLKSVRDQFVRLGFNAKQVEKLLDQFGYGADDLAKFRRRLKEARDEERELNKERRQERLGRRQARRPQEERSFFQAAMENVVDETFASMMAEAFTKAQGEEGADFQSVVSATVSAAVRSIENRGTDVERTTRAMSEIAAQLFAQVLGPQSAFGRQQAGVMDARASFTLALAQALGESESLVSQRAEAFTKRRQGKKLTPEEEMLIATGTTSFSLDVTELAGARNIQILTSLVAAASEVARAQLAGGEDAFAVTEAFKDALAEIQSQFSELGFNTEDIQAFFDTLGYSEEALDAFTGSITDAQDAVVTNPWETGGVAQMPTAMPEPNVITNNIYLPYGDPEAVALAVANRQAMSVL